jgi:hypothetical protein
VASAGTATPTSPPTSGASRPRTPRRTASATSPGALARRAAQRDARLTLPTPARRQKAICQGADGRYGRYQDLFTAPSGDELEQQYKDIVGDSFTSIDPTFAALFRSVSSSTLDADSAAAKDICDSSIFASMDLDDVRRHARARLRARALTQRAPRPPAARADHYRVPVPPHRAVLPVERLVAVLPHVPRQHRLAPAAGRLRLAREVRLH